jgi:hypothetical protein
LLGRAVTLLCSGSPDVIDAVLVAVQALVPPDPGPPEVTALDEQVALGQQFLDRAAFTWNRLHELHHEIEQELKRRSDQGAPPSEHPAWSHLGPWWETTGRAYAWPIRPEQLTELRRRFELLVLACRSQQKWHNKVPPVLEEELKAIILEVGRKGLQIPYDERTKTFLLDGTLPDGAPEVVLTRYARVYEALTEKGPAQHREPTSPRKRFNPNAPPPLPN